ncbi:hypothetical protein V1477_012474 [Vespula maculifrons]|uniref:Uncharacterized protein n=1 Tax=Vespula maculifrons TaxID=7453 RepID=A0ABD2BXM5_VESMC
MSSRRVSTFSRMAPRKPDTMGDTYFRWAQGQRTRNCGGPTPRLFSNFYKKKTNLISKMFPIKKKHRNRYLSQVSIVLILGEYSRNTIVSTHPEQLIDTRTSPMGLYTIFLVCSILPRIFLRNNDAKRDQNTPITIANGMIT